MKNKVILSAAGNTEIPAYLCLIENGYTVSVIDAPNNEQQWIATKDNVHLSGNSPLELLALESLLKQKGESWAATDNEIEEFINEFSQNNS